MIENNRILIVDDDPGIRESYQEILSPSHSEEVLSEGASLFEGASRDAESVHRRQYDLSLVDRGEKGVNAVKKAKDRKQPFAVAFIDMKMPGMDGAETARRIWKIDPNMNIVIVTAYSEYTPDDVVRVTGRDDIFYLRKPFNPEEIRQFARALGNQWIIEREKELLSKQLKEANEELRGLNQNLQKKVEEQTALLIQSEKMASVGILAAGVAHEINNPISFVSGNLSTLRKYKESIGNLLGKYREMESYIDQGRTAGLPALLEEIRELRENEKIDFILEDTAELVEESLEGTRRVRDIVKDLKTFSRVDEAELKHIDLHEAMDAMLNIIRNELKYKAEIRKDYGDLPEVRCFAQKISQAFMNILMNAAQAIEDNGTIKISTRYVEDGRRVDDKGVEIEISDTGHGISKEDIPRIFDPFFTTKPLGQGMGLGLSITYDIVKAHGGTIRVDSEEGEGTTFIIWLPTEVRI